MRTSQLTPIETQAIIELFIIKKWEIDENDKYSLFNRYKYIFSNFKLNDEEKNLFLELSKELHIVDINEYIRGVTELLKRFVIELENKELKDIYIMPIITKEKDEKNEIKSSTAISYMFLSTNIYYNEVLSQKNIKLIGGYNDLYYRIKNTNLAKNPLIIVDDFIGTGKQAMDSIKDLIESGIKKENIVVLCLYIQEEGKKMLENEGINFLYYKSIGKCITRKFNGKKELIKSISDKLNIKSDHLGYGDAEALISLIRTPNNTLPMFHSVKKKRRGNISPFPRN